MSVSWDCLLKTFLPLAWLAQTHAVECELPSLPLPPFRTYAHCASPCARLWVGYWVGITRSTKQAEVPSSRISQYHSGTCCLDYTASFLFLGSIPLSSQELLLFSPPQRTPVRGHHRVLARRWYCICLGDHRLPVMYEPGQSKGDS